MELFLHIFLIVVYTLEHCSCNDFLIRDYFRTNHLPTLLLMSCENEITSVERLRVLHGKWINVWDISGGSVSTDFNYDRFFGRYSHPHGVVVNLECNETISLLTQLSRRILFHNERFWLIFTTDVEEAVIMLNKQNINVDAEIVLAVPVHGDQRYSLYEVFNPASNRGGRLNITQLGYWSTADGFNVTMKQTKIERRRDLGGVTLSSVISLTNIPNQTSYLEHLNSNELTHLDSMNRMMYRMFVLMMDMHNFKLHIRLSNVWGLLDSKGKWSGAIVGSLLTDAPKNIKTVKQLLNSPFRFGVDVVPYVIDNFHVAKDESTVQLYNKVMKSPEKVVMPLQTGSLLMKEGGFVFNTDGSYAYIMLRDILSDSEKCELQQILYIPRLPTGPAVPNKSPFKELIKISIRKITETGILSHYNKVWYGTPPKCETSDLTVTPVDIVHFSSAIYMLIAGIVSSLAVLILEIVVFNLLNLRTSREKRNIQ